jgi:predicted ArsR family transcriptional regulator
MTMPTLSSPETAERVLAYLREHPTASFREIGYALSIGRSTADRAVQRLIAEGVVTVERLGTGAGYPTTYRVSDRARPASARIEQAG